MFTELCGQYALESFVKIKRGMEMDNKVKYIPVEVLEQELTGCQFAIQCDQVSTIALGQSKIFLI